MSVKHIFKEKFESGIRYDAEEKTLIFDFEKDEPEDIINLVNITLGQATSKVHIYLLGYEFTPKVNEDLKKKFLIALKRLLNEPIDIEKIRHFMVEPIGRLCAEIRKLG